jgi:hypothetical protein
MNATAKTIRQIATINKRSGDMRRSTYIGVAQSTTKAIKD